MIEMNGTKIALKAARARGADRLYGRIRSGEPERYLLDAVDGDGVVHFSRSMAWPVFQAAVSYWEKTLSPSPNLSMLPEDPKCA